MALSVLGAGAVGIGDYIGSSNVSLIMACAMADGTLLSPSRPSTYVRSGGDLALLYVCFYPG